MAERPSISDEPLSLIVVDARPLDVPGGEKFLDIGGPDAQDLFIQVPLHVDIRGDDDD